MPRARVFIDGEDVGLSPTKAIRKTRGTVEVRLEHVALGSSSHTVEVDAGVTNEVSIRW